MPKAHNTKYVTLMGETSCGKSSIYNWMFGLALKTGQSETSMEMSKIHVDEERNRVYWDSPGFNDEIEIYNADLLKAFYQIDCVFIMTDRSFKMCKKSIQVMNKINPPKLILVRTKCDLLRDDQEFKEAVATDSNYLKELDVKREILYISAQKPDSFRDNKKFKKYLEGEK